MNPELQEQPPKPPEIVEINDLQNKDVILSKISEHKKHSPNPNPTPTYVKVKPNPIEKKNVFYKIFNFLKFIKQLFTKKYREIKYRKIESVTTTTNDLITIPLNHITNKNKDEVNQLISKISRTDNLGFSKHCIRNKKNGRVVIDFGTLDDLKSRYNDDYEIVESAIK